VDLTGGVTPRKRSKYAENVLDETMVWGVQLPPAADRTIILNEFESVDGDDPKKMKLIARDWPMVVNAFFSVEEIVWSMTSVSLH